MSLDVSSTLQPQGCGIERAQPEALRTCRRVWILCCCRLGREQRHRARNWYQVSGSGFCLTWDANCMSMSHVWKGYHKKDRWFKTTSKVLPMSNTIFAWYIECWIDRCVCRTRLVASNHQCFHPFDKIMMNYINLYYNPLFCCPCPFLVWVVSHEPERGKRSFICNLFLGLAHMSNSISIRYVHKALTEHRVILKSHWWIIHFISLLKWLFGGITNFQTNPVELPSDSGY